MASKTIWLKGDGLVKEANAGGVITPGHLVFIATDGDVEVHGTAASNAIPAFALEADFIGQGIDTDYALADRVQYLMPQRGAEIFALVAASAAAIVIGSYLESAGDGLFVLLAFEHFQSWRESRPFARGVASRSG
ncbi:MAG: hypothetical protein E4G99_08775, partial [Anaerolineales bacterium]